MVSLRRRFLTIIILLLVSPLTSNSRSAKHWKLDDDGAIVEVQNDSASADPLFVLLSSRSGNEGLTKLSPSTLPIPAVLSTVDRGNDFIDSRLLAADPDDSRDAGDDGNTGGSNSSTDDTGQAATDSSDGSAGGATMSIRESTLSAFLLHNHGLSLVDGSGQYYPRRGNLLLDGGVPKESRSGGRMAPVYSRLNVSSPLTCAPPVGSTHYDSLDALQQRDKYPVLQELEVAVIFKKVNSNVINLTAVELDLQEALVSEGKPSLALLNELGNFWRVQGNTLEAVECFRSALSQQPDNADVLLNLARLLLNMGFIEDARSLAYKSLAVASPDHNSWLQHFTLADTYERSGAQEETIRELSHTLDLNPGFKPAELLLAHLKQKHSSGFDSYLLWTVTIIVSLSGLVLMLLYTLLVWNQAQAAETKVPPASPSLEAESPAPRSPACCGGPPGSSAPQSTVTSSTDADAMQHPTPSRDDEHEHRDSPNLRQRRSLIGWMSG